MEIDAKAPEGNAFSIMGFVQELLCQSGRTDDTDDVMKRMRESDYENLCNVAEEVTFGSIRVINRD